MGSKKKDTTYRSRIIDNFLAKFKKAVNSTAPEDTTVADASAVVRAAAVIASSPSVSTFLSQSARRASGASTSRSEAVGINSSRGINSAQSSASISSTQSAASITSSRSEPSGACTPSARSEPSVACTPSAQVAATINNPRSEPSVPCTQSAPSVPCTQSAPSEPSVACTQSASSEATVASVDVAPSAATMAGSTTAENVPIEIVVPPVQAPVVSTADPANTNSSTEQPKPIATEDDGVVEKRCADDFIFGRVLGDGSFSSVYQCKEKSTDREFAIKVCRKSFILREFKSDAIKRERAILAYMSNHCSETRPFFVKIHSSFQDLTWLFFVLSYARGGELFDHIRRAGHFSEECTRFYGAEILHALEHMHSLGIIHRDLKPENILLDENWHVQISDFGCARFLEKDVEPAEGAVGGQVKERRYSFVGTAQYVPPELLSGKGARDRTCDLWAFGAILYQMAAGRPPFRSSSEYLIFQKIKSLEYEFPEGFSPDLRDLVEQLLVKDPKARLGAADGDTYTSIRAHKFFDGVVFEELYKQEPPCMYSHFPSGTPPEGQQDFVYKVPDVKPGFNEEVISRILAQELGTCTPPEPPAPPPPPPPPKAKTVKAKSATVLGLETLTPREYERRLNEQRVNNPRWHSICNGNLILKMGLVLKRKGMFPRKRMLLLTTGPQGPKIYYADPDTMMRKGEIPCNPRIREEASNFKVFFVHVPGRTYYLHDPNGYALEWCKAIRELSMHTGASSS